MPRHRSRSVHAPRHSASDLRDLDLNLLPVLDALLLTRGVSSAGLRLGLSQSRMSGALAQLRETLKDPLLIRNGNRMLLTPRAEELQPRVARLMEEIGATLGTTAGFQPEHSRRAFRIAATDYVAHVLLPGVAARLRSMAPQAALEILPCERGAGDLLTTRQADLVVADRWLLRDERETRTLFSETFVSLVRHDHPRMDPTSPTLDAFLGEDHALISPRGMSPGNVDMALAAVGRSRRVAVTVPFYLAAAQFVAATDLVLTLPRRIARSLVCDARLRCFDVPIRVPGFDVVSLRHHGSRSDAGLDWLERQVMAAAKQVDRPAAA